MFTGTQEINNIVMMLSALWGSEAVFKAGKTILLTDEIQDYPEASTALKFFRMDGRYNVIETGSLSGVKEYDKESFPPTVIGKKNPPGIKCLNT